jgi:hypothetical protein
MYAHRLDHNFSYSQNPNVHNKNATARGLYFDVIRQFGELLDRVGWNEHEENDRAGEKKKK